MERTLYLSHTHTHTHMWNSSPLPSAFLPAFSDYTNMGRKHNAQSRACQNSDAPGMLTWWCWISQLPLLPLGLTQLQFLSVQRSTIDEMWLPDLLFAQPLATSGWSEALASTVKVIETALLTLSACTNSGQWASLHELWQLLWNPAKDWGCQIPAVSLSSADTPSQVLQCTFTLSDFYMRKYPNNREAPGIFCF